MARKNLLARLNQSGESASIIDTNKIDISEPIVERQDQKIDIEIRDIVRVKPQDFWAVKNSYEQWAQQWD